MGESRTLAQRFVVIGMREIKPQLPSFSSRSSRLKTDLNTGLNTGEEKSQDVLLSGMDERTRRDRRDLMKMRSRRLRPLLTQLNGWVEKASEFKELSKSRKSEGDIDGKKLIAEITRANVVIILTSKIEEIINQAIDECDVEAISELTTASLELLNRLEENNSNLKPATYFHEKDSITAFLTLAKNNVFLPTINSLSEVAQRLNIGLPSFPHVIALSISEARKEQMMA